jgi:hypothetical protein
MDSGQDILLAHCLQGPIPGCDRLWGTWAPLRVMIFLWLALRRRRWTADRRRWHGLNAPDHCHPCDQEPETIDHIVASCSFSRQVWWNILAVLGANAAQIGRSSILDWWDAWRRAGTATKGRERTLSSRSWHGNCGKSEM